MEFENWEMNSSWSTGQGLGEGKSDREQHGCHNGDCWLRGGHPQKNVFGERVRNKQGKGDLSLSLPPTFLIPLTPPPVNRGSEGRHFQIRDQHMCWANALVSGSLWLTRLWGCVLG